MFFHSLARYLRKVDVCVIGGGPSGIAAALRAVDFGKRVCIVENYRIGGADLWNGALQSKTMWEMAKFVRLMNGNTANRFMKCRKTLPPIDHKNIFQALVNAAETREKDILHQLKAVQVDVIYGTGKFETPHSISVALRDGGEDKIEADYFLISAGAKPRPHASVPADGKIVFTSDDIMQQPFPKEIVIIGAGVIGCEFASIFANFGMTRVHVIEKSGRILPMEDEDISLFVQNLLEAKNVSIHHHSALEKSAVLDGKFHYTLRDLRNNSLSEYCADSALVSIGREPNLAPLQLEKIGIKVVKNRIARDTFFRVPPYEHIYASGDISTNVALVNVGELEGRTCIEHMYNPRPESDFIPRLDNLSTIMFLDQEVAGVGLNEQQCRKKNIAYKMARYGYEFVSRSLAAGNTRGFVKLIVTNDKKMEVLGVRAVGPNASTIIELASLAIHNRESAHNLSDLRTTYPSVTQGFQECLRMLLGTSILKPNVFPQLIVKEWSPSDFTRGRAYQNKKI